MNAIRKFLGDIGAWAGGIENSIRARGTQASTWANGLSRRELGLLAAASLGATMVIAVGAFSGAGNSSLAGLLGKSFAAESSSQSGDTGAGGSSSDSGSGDSGGLTSLPPPASDTTVSTSGSTTSTSTPTTTTTPTPTPAAVPDDTNPESTPDTTPDPNPDPGPQAGRIKHVFVINLSSPGYDETFGESSQMPYLAETLRPQGQLLSNYSLLDENALPNYIAAISGQPPNKLTSGNCSTYKEFAAGIMPDKKGVISNPGCIYPDTAQTIADQFTLNSYVWHGYHEDMVNKFGPANCAHPENNGVDEPEKGGYAASRNPFVYFRSLLDLGDCALNDVDLTKLKTDLNKADKTPAFSFIAPNLCNAGVPGQCADGEPDGPAAADTFLKSYVPAILKSPAYKKDGLLVITFGEVHAAAEANVPTRVGTVLLSPYVSTNTASAQKLNPYSLLKTFQDLFGFDYLANAAAKSTKSFSAPLLGNVGDS